MLQSNNPSDGYKVQQKACGLLYVQFKVPWSTGHDFRHQSIGWNRFPVLPIDHNISTFFCACSNCRLRTVDAGQSSRSKLDCGSGWLSKDWKVSGLILAPCNLHVEISLGKVLNQKLPLISCHQCHILLALDKKVTWRFPKCAFSLTTSNSNSIAILRSPLSIPIHLNIVRYRFK